MEASHNLVIIIMTAFILTNIAKELYSLYSTVTDFI